MQHAIGDCSESTGIRVRSALPPFEVPRIPVIQHWHRRFHTDPRNRWLRGLAHELFTPETDGWKGRLAKRAA